MKTTKYTKELLEDVVSSSKSFAEVLRKLGKKWSGGQQQNVKKWIAKYEIDISHFLGQSINKGSINKNRKHWSEILVLNESLFWREKTFLLKRAMLDCGCEYKCCECGQDGLWRGKKLTLQVNHKNGNWKDNRPENLEFLCPNCHCTTEGWSGRK